MSAVARLLMQHGDVSGSDQGQWPLSEMLRELGATVHGTFDPSHIDGADVVVRSSAYREDNVEVAAALARGITVWRRHDSWRYLSEGKRVVALAGTHGKTTTTAMTWQALRAAGIDASLICGAVVATTGTNAHVGTSDVLVIEADEYDRVFHALAPQVAVVMNVDHDHVDLFPTPEDYMEAFRVFVGGIKLGGTLVACADDPGSARLAAETRERLRGRTVTTYGTSPDAEVSVSVWSKRALSLRWADREERVELRVPGEHNARNAAAAVAAAVAMGADFSLAARGVMGFFGTERRLEELGESAGVKVIDDYAHHPVEIRASIEAVRGSGRVVALFQPHTASRLTHFFDGFAEALRKADAVVVADTFGSARQDVDQKGAARALAEAAGAAYARDAEEAAARLAELTRPGDTVLVLGAGDIRPAGERLLQLLREREMKE